jgi:hypothetical protein
MKIQKLQGATLYLRDQLTLNRLHSIPKLRRAVGTDHNGWLQTFQYQNQNPHQNPFLQLINYDFNAIPYLQKQIGGFCQTEHQHKPNWTTGKPFVICQLQHHQRLMKTETSLA